MTNVSEAFPPIDYTDLCDVVQRLRLICWTASLNSMRRKPRVDGWLSFDDLDSFPPYIEALNSQVRDFADGKREKLRASCSRKPRKFTQLSSLGNTYTAHG